MANRAVESPRHASDPPVLALLGGFSLRLGEPHAVLSAVLPRQVHRVVAAVVLTGADSRGQLAGTLWPDVGEDRARASLRTALWQLNQASTGIVSAAGPQLRLHDDVVVDVTALRTAIALALQNQQLTAAQVALIRDGPELLPGWYDDWVVYYRETLIDQRLNALERLARNQLGEREPSEALVLAQAMVARAPLRDSARQLILQAHLALGNAADALEEYHRYRRVLHDELGLRPSGQLRALIEPLLAVREKPHHPLAPQRPSTGRSPRQRSARNAVYSRPFPRPHLPQ